MTNPTINPSTATDAEIADYLNQGGDLGPLLATGRLQPNETDRVTVGAVYDPDDETTVIKSLRIPHALWQAAADRKHPQGFSGVVRDALTAFLAEDTDAEVAAEVEQALTVLRRAASRLRSAA